MNRHDVFSGGLGVIIGIIFCIGSHRLGLGRVSEPGPGFLPFLVGGILFFLSANIIINGLRRNAHSGGMEIKGIKKLRKVGLILLALIFYIIFLNYIGFSATTFLFVAFLMKMVEKQRWVRTLVTAFFITLGSYAVFQSWLKLDFPLGPWGF